MLRPRMVMFQTCNKIDRMRLRPVRTVSMHGDSAIFTGAFPRKREGTRRRTIERLYDARIQCVQFVCRAPLRGRSASRIRITRRHLIRRPGEPVAAQSARRLVRQRLRAHGIAIAISESQRMSCCPSAEEYEAEARGKPERPAATERLRGRGRGTPMRHTRLRRGHDRRTSNNKGRTTDAKRWFVNRRRKALTSPVFSSVKVLDI